METNNTTPEESSEPRCLECAEVLLETDDREVTDDGVFCRSCFQQLSEEVEAVLQQQGAGINWPLAITGAVIGGGLGAFAWWGITVATGWSIGFLAILIGLAVAKGIQISTGGKRSRELQILAVAVSVISYFYGNYFVVRSFAIQQDASYGDVLTWLPNIEILVEVSKTTLDGMALLFLGIAVYFAWQNLKPLRLNS